MKSHYKKLLEYADAGVEKTLKRQCLDVMDSEFGGFPEMRKGFTEHSAPIGTASSLITLYYNDDSKYHRDERLLLAADRALDNVLSHQHEDGTIDLVETNFHCAATMGFTFKNAIPAFRIIKKYNKHTEREDSVQAKFQTYIENGCEGMVNGGFHTPNHRWVVASALSMCKNELGREDLMDEINLYLNEGIDCNKYGEWTERSAGIYNKVNNDGMITMAEELDRPDLLEHVRRNLNMMLKYFEPDDTLFTMNSHRQDIGKKMYPMKYYENFLMTAHYLKDKQLAYMADYLFNMINDYKNDTGPLGYGKVGACLSKYMLHDFLREDELEKEKPDWTNYEVFYDLSNLVRRRNGNSITTITAESPMFMKFQKGLNQVFIRFASSFFGTEGRFTPDSIVKIDGGYRLHYRSDWGYVRPLGKPDRPTKNGHTNIEHRERANMQVFEVNIDIFPFDDGVKVEIDSMGVENLPCKLEMIFEPGGFFDCEQTEFKAIAGQHVMVRYGDFDYIKGADKITVEGAFGKTNYHSDLRGSYPEVPGAFTVYFTDWSPTKRTVIFRGL